MEDSNTIYNPWREFIENVIDGSNYFRASEYRTLLEELDGLYADRANLLAALDKIVRYADSEPDGGDTVEVHRANIERARAAIKKATGA